MQSDGVVGAIAAGIAALPLAAIRERLCHSPHGPHWSAARAEAAERDYRRYLQLILEHPGKRLVPTLDVDAFWHAHILDTVRYADDISGALGRALHHEPDYGWGSAAAEQELAESFAETVDLYLERFGESPAGEDGASGSVCGGSSCSSRGASGAL